MRYGILRKLDIRLLGTFSIRTTDGEEFPLPRKNKAVLAALAMNGARGLSREKLIDLFWGERDEEQAQASLRQSLASIRRVLGSNYDCLQTNATNVAIDAVRVTIDAREFEELSESSGFGDRKRALDLYQGDLLDSAKIKEKDFETWLRPLRERLRGKAITLLIKELEEADEGEKVIVLASRLLDLDPTNEVAHRALMRTYAARGRENTALQQFIVCRELLEQELGVGPSHETVVLFEAIKGKRRRPVNREQSNSDLITVTASMDKAPPLPAKPSIAVLPFKNRSGDPDQSYFSEGLTENIIAGLSRFRDILVIGVKSILVVRDQTTNLREIGRVLGVAHIVEGGVRKIGNRVRVTARLVDAATGQHLWAQNYDRDLDDIFAVEDEITDIIVASLAGQVEQLEIRRVTEKITDDPIAYDCVLRGRRCLNRYTRDGEFEARRHFEQALELDPEYASAYAGMSISFLHEYVASWSETPEATLDRAYDLARKAVALDDADSPARYALSLTYLWRGQHELAEVHMEKALELNPNDYHNLCLKSGILARSGRPVDSIKCSIEAMRLNPLAPENCLYFIGIAEYITGRYERALAAFCKVNGRGLFRPA
ncbi:MAG: hypothetical protein HOM25_21840 [Rhodospirillaceae bacterium]|nr:hypothetical protein [Rhodospirillaceae bacterium]